MSSSDDPAVTKSPASIPCIICSQPSSLKCGRCKQAPYCSPECQTTDWYLHKILCSSFKDYASRPRPNLRRAIACDYKDSKPHFIWVEVETKQNGNETPDKHLNKLVGGDAKLFITENPVRNRFLAEGPIGICCKWQDAGPYRSEMKPDNEEMLNKAIFSLIETGACWLANDTTVGFRTALPMFGNVIFLSFEDVAMTTVRDATFCDLRDLVDQITTPPCDPKHALASLDYDHSNCPPGGSCCLAIPRIKVSTKIWPFVSDLQQWPSRAQKVKGVRVRCVGDGELIITAVEFPRDHPFLMDTARFPPLALKKLKSCIDFPGSVGLPLAWIWNEVKFLDILDSLDTDTKALHHEVGEFLKCLIPEVGIENSDGGHERKLGTACIMDFTFIRGDLKDLYVEHIRVFYEFFKEKLVPFIAKNPFQENCSAVATKQTFESYFQLCKQKYGWADAIVSPYEIERVGNTIVGNLFQRNVCAKQA